MRAKGVWPSRPKGDGSAETPSFVPLGIEGPRSAPAAPIRETEGIEIVVDGIAIRLPEATPAARLVEIVSGLRSRPA